MSQSSRKATDLEILRTLRQLHVKKAISFVYEGAFRFEKGNDSWGNEDFPVGIVWDDGCTLYITPGMGKPASIPEGVRRVRALPSGEILWRYSSFD